MEYIENLLDAYKDEKFADFQAKLIPGVPREKIIGVRTPILRKLAGELLNDSEFIENYQDKFLSELPHNYFDENVLHGELISRFKDYKTALIEVKKFLPFVDNWAVCDLLSPKAFKKHKPELFSEIVIWLQSDETYTVRFGVNMLMKYFLDEDFELGHLSLVENAKGEDYYVKMVKAWYYSVALVKHYDETLEYLEASDMDVWVYNKALQKARESYRISDEKKQQLKLLKK